MTDLKTLSESACFGGTQGFYEHASSAIGLPMRFGVYRPPPSGSGPLPVVFCLAGLTCTHETFAIKAGAQQHAARHGLVLVTPDTSPRDTGIAGATGDWEFGEGAGFYLDATAEPWRQRFRMETHVADELRALVVDRFDGDDDRVGVLGHSMGGHGALTLALRRPGRYRSVSAIAPIAAPRRCPWGQKAFGRYFGPESEADAAWRAHDASELVRDPARRLPPMLVDQGLADAFLADGQLLPEAFEAACAESGQPLTLRRHPRHDHGYWFIQSVVGDHLAHHARLLGAAA